MTVLEPGFPSELTTPVLTHLLKQYRSLGLVIKVNPLDLRDYDKLDTSIDGNFTNNLVAQPIFTDAVSEKIYNSSIRDHYVPVGMHLAVDPVNSVTPQLQSQTITIKLILKFGKKISSLRAKRMQVFDNLWTWLFWVQTF